MYDKLKNAILPLFLWIFLSAESQVSLPRLISDGMILQRNARVKIWGWAAPHEKISIRFHDSAWNTAAGTDGKWMAELPEMKEGGPFDMEIQGTNQITIRDILIGDVWVCSGQSNMELPMSRVRPVYEDEILNSENRNIRQFTVPQRYNFKEAQENLQGGKWVSADPQSILSFSAVAYFFAKELFNTYHVPIGIINASLGGSPAEAWMSEEALKEFPSHYTEAQRYKDNSLIKKTEEEDNQRIRAWYKLLQEKDEGYKNPSGNWRDPNLNTSGWPSMNIPGYWAGTSLGQVNGVIWFRKKVTIPAELAGKEAILILGRIVDADSVFINGSFIGTTSYQYPPRRYSIPARLLKEGENTLVVRVINSSGKGGFVPDKPYEIISGKIHVDLNGEWQYKLGAEMAPLRSQTFIRWKPLGLYNGMIHPLLNYRIKGVVWYQGESNAGRPQEYRNLLPALIKDWRKSWNQNDVPFIYAQLPNFMEAKNEPGESDWALLREAQLKTLSVPATGMAITIDLGEWNDIHPLNKKDVGNRLALAARNVAYGESLAGSGPLFKEMEIKGNRLILSFDHTGSGLTARGGELKYFAIAGADKQFRWAKAIIKNNKVVVWHDQIANPVAVRYAWADNPEGANLYNKEGLPASPFRTDIE